MRKSASKMGFVCDYLSFSLTLLMFFVAPEASNALPSWSDLPEWCLCPIIVIHKFIVKSCNRKVAREADDRNFGVFESRSGHEEPHLLDTSINGVADR